MARRELTEQEQEQFDKVLTETMTKPLDYVRHDANARCDEALRRATAEHGMGFLGSWWVLVELLCSKSEHEYDVRDATGWAILALDMSTCGRLWTTDECKDFCEQLAGYGLIERELYDMGRIVNDRICREVEKYARAVAGKSLGGWKPNALSGNAKRDAKRNT